MINLKKWAIATLFITLNLNVYACDCDCEDTKLPKSHQEEMTYKYTYQLGNGCAEVYDPYEKLNRKIFTFNSVLDYFLLRPVAKMYDRFTNDYTKARVGSFLDNVSTPLTTVNYSLQLNLDGTLKSFWRFVINTTIGIGGLFDVATKANLTVTPQTLGSTFAHYGVGPGPYLVLPIFGSTNARDALDITVANTALNPVKYAMHKDFKMVITGTKLIHDRAEILPFTDYITKHSTDAYIAVRNAIHQKRETNIEYPSSFKCPKVTN